MIITGSWSALEAAAALKIDIIRSKNVNTVFSSEKVDSPTPGRSSRNSREALRISSLHGSIPIYVRKVTIQQHTGSRIDSIWVVP